ncbi:hypothetical protein ACEQ8H_000868 [Pleosporales sp. CAS-2024a]
MAKKKNKKNSQQQVDASTPLPKLKAVTGAATEESPANGDAEQHSLAPPLDAPTPAVGSTPGTDQDLDLAQDTPSEAKSSRTMPVEATHHAETTEPIELGHVPIDAPAPLEDAVVEAPQSQPDVLADEAKAEEGSSIPPHDADAAEQPPPAALDEHQVLPEPSASAEEIAHVPLDEEPPVPPTETPLDADASPKIEHSLETHNGVTSVDPARVATLAPVVAEAGTEVHEDAAVSDSPVAEAEQSLGHEAPPEAPSEVDAEVNNELVPHETEILETCSEVAADASTELVPSHVEAPEAPSEAAAQVDAEVAPPQIEGLEAPVTEQYEHHVSLPGQLVEPEAVLENRIQPAEPMVPDDNHNATHASDATGDTTSIAHEAPAAQPEDAKQEEVAVQDVAEAPGPDLTHTASVLDPPSQTEIGLDTAASTAPVEPEMPHLAKETTKQRRQRLVEEETQREEQERLEQESFEQYRIDQERLEMARLEQKRLERERSRQERAERERIEQARLAQEKLQQEQVERERLDAERAETERREAARVEQERLETERFEAQRLERIRVEQERLVNERIEQDRIEQERLEAQGRKEQEAERQSLEEERVKAKLKEKTRLEHEAAAAAAASAEAARMLVLQAQAEATQRAHEHDGHESKTAEDMAREVGVGLTRSPSSHSSTRATGILKAVTKPAHLSTRPPDAFPQPPVPASDMRTSNPGSRVPTPAASAGRASSPRSAATDASKSRAYASEQVHQVGPTPRSEDPDHAVPSRRATDSPALPAPRPRAVSQLIQDNRPPAPSPPVGRLRARHAPAFEDTEDDSDSAMVRTGRRQCRGVGGGEDYDRPSGSYPPPPAHHRFASRVPAEQSYAIPPPPQQQQPPGYHPYYPPAAPPHYQNPNYRVTQPGYPPPNPYLPASHSSSSPYTDSWTYSPGYRHDSPPQRHDTLASRDYSLGLAPLDPRPVFADDPGGVFSRIAQAIPDLHVLLARYKETHGQLSVREELLRRSTIEQEQRLRAKDDEIAALKEQARNLEYAHSTEAARLRANLENQGRQLQDQRAETERFKKEAQETKIALEAAMKSWEARYKELAEAHAVLSRAAVDEQANFDQWKSTLMTRTDAEKIALAIQFDQRLKEADMLAERQRQEAADAFARERDELVAHHERQHLELQASFDQVRHELEAKLEFVQQEREDAIRYERESREAWLAEREALMKSHRDDRESIRRGWDGQRSLLEAQYKKSKDESDQAWIQLHADASKRAEDENARVNQLIKEKEELQKRYNALRAESEQEKAIIKSVATNLESEKARLEKLMECYGDIAEIKSKGDTYYLVSFSQLQKQIVDLATTHFVHLPVRPPAEDLAQVPSNLPSFLGDTIASRQVRAAYIAHTVSKLITYRVFGPFLFSLGRRYDKADSLFLSMSHHIRDKSTRKEAIWRQQTLLAAFTSSGAKQRINTAAGTVVEEIVSAIKHFADPREEEGIKIAVKRIVKLAAETWRFARLEREMINATMPALLDEEHQFTGPEYWPSYDSYKPEGTLIGSLVDHPTSVEEKPQLLLRLFPVIWREPKHENFHLDGEKPDEGCIFHHGLALYDDAEPVVQRMEELKSAGLPSYTTTSSPTPAEDGKFPPPIVPPPRDAPPNPPTTIDDKDRSTSQAAPPSPAKFLDKTSARQVTPPPPPSSIPSFDDKTPSTFVKAYRRPPPVPIDFASPRDLIGLPPPVESVFTSHTATAKKMPPPPPPPRPPPRSAPPPPPAPEPPKEPRHTTSIESAVLPATFPEPSPSDKPPTPPHSRSGTPEERPVSPLFEAIDEIESLQSHQIRPSSKSLSRRRSTHSRRSKDSKDSKDEMPEVEPTIERPDTGRRTSGYALSIKSAKTVDSERTDRTSRSEKTNKTDKSDRDPKSRYMCESRSAAIKALYPDSPLAGQSSSGSIKGSVSSSKKKDRDSKELKQKKGIADNATFVSENTWDTTSEFPATEAPSPKKKEHRSSKDMKRRKSIADNSTFISVNTWDTTSELTNMESPPRPCKKEDYNLKELRPRKTSFADNSTFISVNTWDTTSEITHAEPPRLKKEDGNLKELRPRKTSFADNSTFISVNTWDTTSEITHAEPPRPKKEDGNSKELRRKKSIDDNSTFVSVNTWDTTSEVTSLAAMNNTHLSTS